MTSQLLRRSLPRQDGEKQDLYQGVLEFIHHKDFGKAMALMDERDFCGELQAEDNLVKTLLLEVLRWGNVCH